MGLFEQTDSVIHHVGLLGEFILCGLHLLDREEIALSEMSKEREDEMTVAVGNYCFGEVIFGHLGDEDGVDRGRGSSSRSGVSSPSPTAQKMSFPIRARDARGQTRATRPLASPKSRRGPHPLSVLTPSLPLPTAP